MKKLVANWKNTQKALGYRTLWEKFWEGQKRRNQRKDRRPGSQQGQTYGPLEPRQLLASVTLEGDVLTVDGTSGNDSIQLVESSNQSSFTVSVNEDPSLSQSFDYASVSKVVVNAKAGDDVVTSNVQIPTELFGNGGDDFLQGGFANDLIEGGSGNDEIVGRAGNDTLLGNADDDTIRGGSGNDTIDGGTGNDILDGGQDDDYVRGRDGSDELSGGQGDDVLEGNAGNDSLYGQAGNDQLSGNDGKDLLEGQAGDDELEGNDGADTLRGGSGDDTLLGGAGKDTLFGHTGDDTIRGGEGSDIAYGGGGNDRIFGGAGKDSLYGHDGDDRIHGNEGQDILLGHGGNDRLFGGDGGDELAGGQGNDRLEGEAGNDQLYGQGGDDSLDGGAGRNLTSGGRGDDIYLVSNLVDRKDVITDTDGDDTLDLSNWSGTNGARFSTSDLTVQTITQGDSPAEVKLRLTDRQSLEHVIGTGLDDTISTGMGSHTWTVSTLDDERDGDYSFGDLSLREALLLAQQTQLHSLIHKVIEFDEALFVGLEQPATIQLSYDGNDDGMVDRLNIKSSVDITGPGAHQLIIRGVNDSQIFHAGGVDAYDGSTTSIEIRGLTLTGAGEAGLKTVGGEVTLREVRIMENLGSGIVSNQTNLRIFDSEIVANRSDTSGAGIRYVADEAGDYVFEIVHSTIAGNISNNKGGGVFVNTQSADGVKLEWSDLRVSTNQATDGSGLFLRDNSGVSNLQFVDVRLEANNGGPDVDGTADAVAAIEATGSVGDPILRDLIPSEGVLVDLSEPLTTANRVPDKYEDGSESGLAFDAPQLRFAGFGADTTSSVIQSWTRDGFALENIDVLARPDQLQSISVRFNQPVTLTTDALRIINDSEGGGLVSSDGVNLYYNAQTYEATWVLPSAGYLEPGYYTLSLNYQQVEATNGPDISFDASFNQQVYVAIPGDLDLDGEVTLLGDAFTYFRNQGTLSDMTWEHGDINGDGAVTVLGDGGKLASNLNRSLVDPEKPRMTIGAAPILAAIEPITGGLGDSISIVSEITDDDLAGDDTYEVTIDWGDGIELGIVGSPTSTLTVAGGTRLYGSTGVYSGVLTVVDSFGHSASESFAVAVADDDLEAAQESFKLKDTADYVKERAYSDVVAELTGLTQLDRYSAKIYWGDGEQSDGVLEEQNNGLITVSVDGSHTHEIFGDYVLRVEIKKGGETVLEISGDYTIWSTSQSELLQSSLPGSGDNVLLGDIWIDVSDSYDDTPQQFPIISTIIKHDFEGSVLKLFAEYDGVPSTTETQLPDRLVGLGGLVFNRSGGRYDHPSGSYYLSSFAPDFTDNTRVYAISTSTNQQGSAVYFDLHREENAASKLRPHYNGSANGAERPYQLVSNTGETYVREGDGSRYYDAAGACYFNLNSNPTSSLDVLLNCPQPPRELGGENGEVEVVVHWNDSTTSAGNLVPASGEITSPTFEKFNIRGIVPDGVDVEQVVGFTITDFREGVSNGSLRDDGGDHTYPNVTHSGKAAFKYDELLAINRVARHSDITHFSIEDLMPAGVDLLGADAEVAFLSEPQGGVVKLGPDGSLAYKRTATNLDNDYFTFTIKTSGPDYRVGMTLQIQNSSPEAGDDTYLLSNASSFEFNVFRNDDDADQDELTVAVTSHNHLLTDVHNLGNGFLENLGDGDFRYTPNSGVVAEDVFTYSITDPYGESDTAEVVLKTVDNQPPVAGDDILSTYVNQALVIPEEGNIFQNDNDPEGDSWTVKILDRPTNGSFADHGDGEIVYEPTAGYTGADRFTYQLADEFGQSRIATVVINVIDRVPEGTADSFEGYMNGPITGDVSTSDENLDGQDSEYALVDPAPTLGTVTLDTKGGFIYQPRDGEAGTDYFYYTIFDGEKTSEPIEVEVVVAAVPAPTTDNATIDISRRNRFAEGTVADYSTSVSGRPLSYRLITDVDHDLGALSFNSDGTFVYEGFEDVLLDDRFQYVAVDGESFSGVGTINFRTINHAPEGADATFSLLHDTDLVEFFSDNLDEDGDLLTIEITSPLSHGEFVSITPYSFVYRPNPGFHETDSFSYRLNDGVADSLEYTIDLNVTNDLPSRPTQNFDVSRGQTIYRRFFEEWIDEDGEAVTIDVLEQPELGTFIGRETGLQRGTFTYTAPTNYDGTQTFTYRIDDGTETRDVTVNLHVTNHLPGGQHYFRVRAGESMTGTYFDEFTDDDGDTVNIAYYSEPVGFSPLGPGQFQFQAGYQAETLSFNYGVDDGYDNQFRTVYIEVVAPEANNKLIHTDHLETYSGAVTGQWNDDATGLSFYVVGEIPDGLSLETDGSFTYTPPLGTTRESFSFVAASTENISIFSAPATVNISIGSEPDNPVDAEHERLVEEIERVIELHELESPGAYRVQVNGLLDTRADAPVQGLYTTGGYSVEAGTVRQINEKVHFGEATLAQYVGAQYQDSRILGALASTHYGIGPLPEGADYSVITSPQSGILVVGDDGHFTYTPNIGYEGPDEFTVQFEDSQGQLGKLTIPIEVGNSAPISDDFEVGTADGRVEFFPRANWLLATKNLVGQSLDLDGDRLSFYIAKQPANGRVISKTDGSVVYLANAGFTGDDSFTYRSSDGRSFSEEATVTIRVEGNANVSSVNEIPWNSTHTGDLGRVLFEPVSINTTHGSFAADVEGRFTYTPTGGYVGYDVAAFEVGGQLFELEFYVVGQAPIAVSDTFYFGQNETISGNVLDNDLNGLTGTLNAEFVSSSIDEQLVQFLSDGSFSIDRANLTSDAPVTIQYKVNNGWSDSLTAEVTLRFTQFDIFSDSSNGSFDVDPGEESDAWTVGFGYGDGAETAEDFVVLVDWGDEQPVEELTVQAVGSGLFSFTSTHTWSDPGTKNMTAEIRRVGETAFHVVQATAIVAGDESEATESESAVARGLAFSTLPPSSDEAPSSPYMIPLTDEVSQTGCPDMPRIDFVPSVSADGDYEGLEGETLTIKLELSEEANEAVTVNLRAEDGSAKEGKDYDLLSDSVTFEAGSTEASFKVKLLKDQDEKGQPEANVENFKIHLEDAQGATIGEDSTINVEIEDLIDLEPIEKLAQMNAELGEALSGDALQYLTWGEFDQLKDAGFYRDRVDGIYDYVILEIGSNYYVYVEPSTALYEYRLFAIAPNNASIDAVKEIGELANWLTLTSAADIGLSIVPGGTSAGYFEEGEYGRGALWLVADTALTLSAVGKLGQVASKGGAVIKSKQVAKISDAMIKIGNVGKHRNLVLGVMAVETIMGADAAGSAVNNALEGQWTEATINGLDALLTATGVSFQRKEYLDNLQKASQSSKKLNDRVDLRKVASRDNHLDEASKKVHYSLEDEINAFNQYWDDAIDSISDPLVKERVLGEIADELASGNQNAQQLAAAIRNGDVDVKFVDDLPLTVRGGYDEVTKRILLRSTDIDDISRLASVVVHEGRHWLDDIGGMFVTIRKAVGNGQPSEIAIELRAHLQQLIYDLEKGINSEVANAYLSGGWGSVVEHVWNLYSE